MEKLYAPWREQFIKQTGSKKENSGCIFCQKLKESHDEENFIIKRLESCFIMLNLYPYNAGHLMVIPNGHHKDLALLTSTERSALMDTTSQAIEIIKSTLKPDGLNVGINLGSSSGAGIPGHVHIHIVPRWNGDTNFMPVIADTKHISVDLHGVYAQLKQAFDQTGE